MAIMSVFCTRCGHRNEDGAKFCESCGASLACPNISAENASRPTPSPSRWRWGIAIVVVLAVGGFAAAVLVPSGPVPGLLAKIGVRLPSFGSSSETLYYVGRNGKWGYVDRDGSEIIPMKYDAPPAVARRLILMRSTAPYSVFESGKWILVDRRGTRLGQTTLDEIRPVTKGLTVCGRIAKQWGCIDAVGKVVVPFMYEAVAETSEDRTAVKSNGRWGYLDQFGAFVIPPSFLDAAEFKNGLALVVFDGKEGGLIDRTGKEVSKKRYVRAAPPGDGVWTVNDGESWAIADLTGDIIQRLSSSLSWVGSFKDGLADADDGKGNKLVIDKSGKVVSSRREPHEKLPRYRSVRGFPREGLYAIQPSDWPVWGFTDMDGHYIVPPLFDSVSDFVEGFAVVQKGNEPWGIDSTGHTIWPGEKKSFGQPTTALKDLMTWKWRVQRSRGSSTDIGSIVEFGTNTIRLESREIPYESPRPGTLRVTINQEPQVWTFIGYGDDLVIFSDAGPIVQLARAEPVSKEQGQISEASGPKKQGNNLLSRLSALVEILGSAPLSPQGPSTASPGTPSEATSAQDIVGLKIGITPEEARQALLRFNPTFKIVESRDRFWNAMILDAGTPGERVVLKFTETQPKAFFIGRSVAFPVGQRPTKEALNKDLVAKYGKPTAAEVGRPWGDYFTWSTSTPKQYREPNPYGLTGCAHLPTGEVQWSAGAGTSPIHLYLTTPECDRLIEASVGSGFDENPKIAVTLGVSITDFALARSDPKHPANVAASAERRKIEEASKNKPKL